MLNVVTVRDVGYELNSVLSRPEKLAPSAFSNGETMIIYPERKKFNGLISKFERLKKNHLGFSSVYVLPQNNKTHLFY